MNKDKKQKQQHNAHFKIKYDDKGRRIFQFNKNNNTNNESNEQTNKETLKQKREENLHKNLNPSTSKFKCEICELIFTDNLAYKDHLNGKKHNLKIRNDMKIKQSSIQTIREKLLSKKRPRLNNNK